MKTCEYPGCHRPARFFMGWNNGKGKHFGMVCATHDRELGRKNLMKYMPLSDVVLFERYRALTVDLMEYPDFPEWLQTHKHATELRELNLSPRAFNALYRQRITLDKLVDMSAEELLKIRMIGKKSVTEIQKALKEYNEQNRIQ